MVAASTFIFALSRGGLWGAAPIIKIRCFLVLIASPHSVSKQIYLSFIINTFKNKKRWESRLQDLIGSQKVEGEIEYSIYMIKSIQFLVHDSIFD
jgi:hypothetical protein